MPTEGPQEGPAEGGTRFIEGGSAETEVGTKPRREAPVTATPGTALGRYMVLGTLGAGGMGTVLRAYDESLDRAIAIKLLHSGTAERHAKRLMREAQALARLSHPNVVHVYEVGRASGQWFIAMELVRGQTLRKWQAARHEWRECVKVYQQAGAGLVAAHAAGLVHRDFKPDNCILDEDGRPRVLDFGLVRETDVPSEGEPLAEATAVDTDAQTPLTRAGTVLGTLAYMPLEQFDGKPADARSDQFSFCVSLYEALYGERPFTEATVGRRTLALMKGDVRPPPKGSRVPAKLRRVVLRGLSPDPDHRWPSMEALLTELRGQTAPRARARLPVLVMGGGLAALSVGLWWSRGQTRRPCQGAQEQLEGVWDDELRQTVKAAILGTELSYAPDTWDRVERKLDDYAEEWVIKHTHVCEATSVRQVQSSEVMDLRMECLRDRRASLRESVGVLAEANEVRVQEAVDLVGSLPRLSRCDDVDALRAKLPPPADPKAAERVQALREQIKRAYGLEKVGEYDDALTLFERLVDQATAEDHAPFLAEAMLGRGNAYWKKGLYPEAERDLKQAYVLAATLGHDVVEAKAVSLLSFVVGHEQARHEQGLQWGVTALALAQGPRVEPQMEASALTHVANILRERGKPQEALDHLNRALVVQQEVFGPDDLAVAPVLDAIGVTYKAQGRLEDALSHQERALAIRMEAKGAGHPDVAMSASNIGNTLRRLGRVEQAIDRHEQALAIQKQTLGVRHPYVAASLSSIGLALKAGDEYEEALPYQRQALAMLEETLGPDHPNVAKLLINLGNTLNQLGRVDEALAAQQRALAINERALGPRHPAVGNSLHAIGTLLRSQGRVEDALSNFRQALEIKEESLGREHPNVALTLAGIGNALDDQGRAEDALTHHERALAILEESLGPDHPTVARELDNVGVTLRNRGNLDEALARHQRALRILRSTRDAKSLSVANVLYNIGVVWRRQGRLADALARQRRVLAIREDALGPSHEDIALSFEEIGRVLSSQGNLDEAATYFRRSMSIVEETMGSDHPGIAPSLVELTEIALEQRDFDAARAYAERAVSIRESSEVAPANLADARFVLARALWPQPGQRPRARNLARQARDALAALGETQARDLARIDAWLDDRRNHPRAR